MDELRGIIAANIQALRLRSGMTQQELGVKLNYTDKAVSKWERGESAPDVSVLLKLARLFEVTLDYLVTDHNSDKVEVEDSGSDNEPARQAEDAVFVEAAEQPLSLVRSTRTAAEEGPSDADEGDGGNIISLAKHFGYKPNLFTVTLMSAASVWLIAVILYVVLSVFVPSFTKAWMCFVFAVPATMIVLLIFNLLWGKMRYSFTLMSALLWSALAAVFIFFMDKQQNWVLFMIGVPAQVLLLLWSKMYHKRKE